MNKKNILSKIIIVIIFSLIVVSCSKEYTTEQKKYISSIEKIRKAKDDFMKNSPNSPFNSDSNAVFHKLNYFDVNPSFVFKSKLYQYSKKDTIDIYDTKGEIRKTVRFGYVKFNYNKKNIKMDVYESNSSSGKKYYSLWFIDKTTGKETYGVGRYLDFKINKTPNFIYTIDFNLAYNPYCSYSAKYSCAIPTKDDYINMEIKAGEKNFH